MNFQIYENMNSERSLKSEEIAKTKEYENEKMINDKCIVLWYL